MRPTKRFEQWLSEPSIDRETIRTLQEYECEICGYEPLDSWAILRCSVPHAQYEGWREFWQDSYDVCWDCVEAGEASFPDRLRKHAQELEQKARELRKLADATWRPSTPDDPEDRRINGASLVSPG